VARSAEDHPRGVPAFPRHWASVHRYPAIVMRDPLRLLLDSRVVDVPMSYNPIVVTLPSLKPFFFNGLQ